VVRILPVLPEKQIISEKTTNTYGRKNERCPSPTENVAEIAFFSVTIFGCVYTKGIFYGMA